MRKFLTLVLALMPLIAAGQQNKAPALIMDAAEDTTYVISLSDIINTQQGLMLANDYSSHIAGIWSRGSFFNIGYLSTGVSFKEAPLHDPDMKDVKWTCDYGTSIQAGRNYRLHKKPILKVMTINLDYIPLDLCLNHFAAGPGATYNSADVFKEGDSYSADYHKHAWALNKWEANYSMSIGPSVTLAPFARTRAKGLSYWKINAYYRFGYCASLMYIQNDPSKDVSAANTLYSKSMSDDFKGDFGHGMYKTYGIDLSWKGIGVGFERRAGDASYFSLNKGVYGNDVYTLSTEMTRIYINFRFK